MENENEKINMYLATNKSYMFSIKKKRNTEVNIFIYIYKLIKK